MRVKIGRRIELSLIAGVFLACCLCVIEALAATPVAAGGTRVALLIGNAKYSAGLPALTNPGRDVATLSQSLKKLNFEVQEVSDADFKGMSRAVRAFGSKSQGAEIAFFYYSGHGMQAREENYLIPVDAKVESEADLDTEAMALKGLMRQIEDARPKTAVVVLDACRDNPVAGRSKSASKGLSRVQNPPINTLVVFAAQAGTTAADNGVFAKALADQMVQPNVSLRAMFDNVGRSVRGATGNKQSIQRDDQLSEDVVLLASLKPELVAVPGVAAAPTAPVVSPSPVIGSAPADAETALWNEVKNSGRADYIQTYVNQYPKGKYLGLAKIELKNLQDQQQAQQKQREQQSWEQAKSTNTVEAYEEHVRQYPSGTYAALAQTAATRLKTEAEQRVQEQKERQEREAREFKPVKVFKDCSDCPDMVVIPGGSFMMGSNDGDKDERPVHQVSVRPFAMGRYEVTQGQWRSIMGTNPSRFSNCGDDCPVDKVSWHDAQLYIQKLNQKTGKNYRLPSEAEWEYAARAGTGSRWGFGDQESDLDRYAWYNNNSGSKTHPVGQKLANQFGLFDMHGNVWEWVQDCWNDSYDGAPTDGSAWVTGDCSPRVLRGGSWFSNPSWLRSASRGGGTILNRDSDYGFRLARTL